MVRLFVSGIFVMGFQGLAEARSRAGRGWTLKEALLKQFVALLAITVLAGTANAQPHDYLELSDAVVVAETVSVVQGLIPVGKPHPDVLPLRYARVTLRVLASIKGDVPLGELDIAVPDIYVEDSGIERTGFFSRRIGMKGLWFLQRHSDGKFRDEGEPKWQAPGLTYAPMSLSDRQFELVETEFRRNSDPLIELAELFAVNWARRPRGYKMYVEQVRRIDPLTMCGYRGSPLLPDDPQRARLFEWLDRRLPEILGERSAEDLLNEYSVRLSWGQDQYSKRFTDLYLSDPRSLKCALPAYLDLFDLLRIFMASERALCAQLAASLPKTMPAEDRVRVTRKVLDFLAIDRTYDVPFLNALADWWSRPDLSPLEQGKPKPDLTPLIEQARRLLDP